MSHDAIDLSTLHPVIAAAVRPHLARRSDLQARAKLDQLLSHHADEEDRPACEFCTDGLVRAVPGHSYSTGGGWDVCEVCNGTGREA